VVWWRGGMLNTMEGRVYNVVVGREGIPSSLDACDR
jgi:hypothetical protein